jgi:hypothetical protein
MHKSTTKCNETLSKWCKNNHGASKIMDTFETYHMYMHCLHSLFCQLPNCNLFTQHVIYLYGETPLVNYGPRSILLHSYYHLLLQALFTFLQTNIFYHTIRLILCLQQTGEIDNLTAIWGKVLWLCCVLVPCCCWCKATP